MGPSPTGVAHSTVPGELGELLGSWRRHLRAQRISPATISTYATAVAQLARFLEHQGMPTAPLTIRRDHVEAFITDLLERWKPATAHNRYRGCHAFFRWLVEEGEIHDNPMERMKPPRLPKNRRPSCAQSSFAPSWRRASGTRPLGGAGMRRSCGSSWTRGRGGARSSI